MYSCKLKWVMACFKAEETKCDKYLGNAAAGSSQWLHMLVLRWSEQPLPLYGYHQAVFQEGAQHWPPDPAGSTGMTSDYHSD